MTTNRIDYAILMEIIEIQTEVVQQGLNLSHIMDLVTKRTQHLTGADGASIELIQNNELVYSASSGMAETFLGLRLKIEHSLSGQCIQERVPLISQDIECDDRVNKEACRRIGLNSMIVMPLVCLEDVVGVLKVLSRKAHGFNEQSIEVLKLISGVIAAAMSNAIKNGENELFHQATHDHLTNISNRSVFYDHLRQYISRSKKPNLMGIITLDIDGLKEINDHFGHRAGDAAIKEVAQRIQLVTRDSDTVSRLGGDEFGIIAMNIENRADLTQLAKRIEDAICHPFIFEEYPIELAVSIGYSLYGEDGSTLDTLIEKADKNMYQVKRSRKKHFSKLNPSATH